MFEQTRHGGDVARGLRHGTAGREAYERLLGDAAKGATPQLSRRIPVYRGTKTYAP